MNLKLSHLRYSAEHVPNLPFCHSNHEGNANDDTIRVTDGGIIKKHRALPLPQNKLIRLVHNFPVNQNVVTEFWCRSAIYDYPFYWITRFGLSQNKQKWNAQIESWVTKGAPFIIHNLVMKKHKGIACKSKKIVSGF